MTCDGEHMLAAVGQRCLNALRYVLLSLRINCINPDQPTSIGRWHFSNNSLISELLYLTCNWIIRKIDRTAEETSSYM